MRGFSRRLAFIVLGVVTFGVLVAFGAGAAGAKGDKDRPADRVVMFASDGMRPDLMEKYAQGKAMPTYKELMKHGVTGDNGMLQAFPPNTGVGWFTMATGTYPSEHGSTNNTFHRGGDSFANSTSFSARHPAGRHDRQRGGARGQEGRADRLGRRRLGRTSTARRSTSRPSTTTVVCSSVRPTRSSRPAPPPSERSTTSGRRARERLDRRAGGRPCRVAEGDGVVDPVERSPAQNPNRTYNVYFYDSVTGGGANYDHAIVCPVGKTGAAPSIDLKVGDFLPIKLIGANGLIGARAGQTVGHYVKLISLTATSPSTSSTPRRSRVPSRPATRPPVTAARGWRRRGPAREVHRRQPAAVGGRRLRPRGGRRRRRGHLRPAGPRPRAGVQPAGDQLRARHPAEGHRARDGGLPVHRRGLAPVHGSRLADRAGRRAEPVLRRQPEVRRHRVHGPRHGPPGRDPRGLHPQRLRGRRREARGHPEADGRRPDHVRRLRPRLRAAVARRQREQGPDRQGDQRTARVHRDGEPRCNPAQPQAAPHRAAPSASNCRGNNVVLAAGEQAYVSRPRQGLLGRRHDPGLRHPTLAGLANAAVRAR